MSDNGEPQPVPALSSPPPSTSLKQGEYFVEAIRGERKVSGLCLVSALALTCKIHSSF